MEIISLYDLVKQINQLNEGKYLHDVMHVDNKADFCIGVSGYPEKHLESFVAI
jgi:methylenetetrahydrofolate reductase (NADPH)